MRSIERLLLVTIIVISLASNLFIYMAKKQPVQVLFDVEKVCGREI